MRQNQYGSAIEAERLNQYAALERRRPGVIGDRAERVSVGNRERAGDSFPFCRKRHSSVLLRLVQPAYSKPAETCVRGTPEAVTLDPACRRAQR